jgi:hypothetical protein
MGSGGGEMAAPKQPFVAYNDCTDQHYAKRRAMRINRTAEEVLESHDMR